MQIKKLGYSSGPWRLLDDAGNDIYYQKVIDHSMMGKTVIDSPFCADTKADLIAMVLTTMSRLMTEVERLRAVAREQPVNKCAAVNEQ